MALTARISPITDHILEELMKSTGKRKVDIIEAALKFYRFHERMRILNEEYERLCSDKKAWAEELEERQEHEGTLLDGLESPEN
ncbi:MAG: hypothetical protein LLG04_11680 [Parachlamydia sp.]|nr:hypothetical protein [Parachlamydia sp.]